jgi:hypothetical protein
MSAANAAEIERGSSERTVMQLRNGSQPRRRGRHVVNRAHGRTILATPKEVPKSRRNFVGCRSAIVRGSHVRSISHHTPLRCQQ